MLPRPSRLDERRDALVRSERFVLSCGEGATNVVTLLTGTGK